MNFDEEIQKIIFLGEKLTWLKTTKMDIQDITAFVLSIETDLWRTRINIEHKLNQK